MKQIDEYADYDIEFSMRLKIEIKKSVSIIMKIRSTTEIIVTIVYIVWTLSCTPIRWHLNVRIAVTISNENKELS